LVVSDTSPLTYLAALNDFSLLRKLFDEIAIPPAVFEEVAIGGARFPAAKLVSEALGNWMYVRDLTDPSKSRTFQSSGLDRGESEALALAVELHSEALLLDDQDAVERARADNLNVIRTAGVYRLAKQRRLIAAVAPKLDDLRSAGFWLSDEHYEIILRSAGEG
jgi:uncharacterized protein